MTNGNKMIITYIRSSSFNRWDWCPHLYFGEYVLGWTTEAGLKALKGTCVHRCLEILANIKLAQQNNIKIITDDIIGKINCSKFNIDKIINDISVYYKTNSNHSWTNKDIVDCKSWTYKLLELNNGKFNPLNQNIVSPEKHFDIVLDNDWAKYEYVINDQYITGHLSLKGTIDLITKINDNCIEVIDYKTGFYKKDWATGEEKTYNKLQNDFQLRLYHLATNILYPQINNILVTIIYINVDGASTLCYDLTTIEETKQVIKERFEEIKRCKKPQLNKERKHVREQFRRHSNALRTFNIKSYSL